VNVNGRVFNQDHAVISIFDHGFLYGEGVYETLRTWALRDDDLLGADEAFLTSTTREVVPIVRVDERTIGSGKPGLVTMSLLDGFRRRAHQLTLQLAHQPG
jgi:branched-subunit amino acid aminotransferase/4-amino-4-deoxychorismate lyase